LKPATASSSWTTSPTAIAGPCIPRAVFRQLSLDDTDELADLLREHRVDAVMHFAALIAVGESVASRLPTTTTTPPGP